MMILYLHVLITISDKTKNKFAVFCFLFFVCMFLSSLFFVFCFSVFVFVQYF